MFHAGRERTYREVVEVRVVFYAKGDDAYDIDGGMSTAWLHLEEGMGLPKFHAADDPGPHVISCPHVILDEDNVRFTFMCTSPGLGNDIENAGAQEVFEPDLAAIAAYAGPLAKPDEDEEGWRGMTMQLLYEYTVTPPYGPEDEWDSDWRPLGVIDLNNVPVTPLPEPERKD